MCEALLNDCVFERLPVVSHGVFPKVHLRVKLYWIEVGDKLREWGKGRRDFEKRELEIDGKLVKYVC